MNAIPCRLPTGFLSAALLGFLLALLGLAGPGARAAGLLNINPAAPLITVAGSQLAVNQAAAAVTTVVLPPENACPDGQELNGALCYPKCQDGYQGVGPVCWKTCPVGYKDDGAFCRKDPIIQAKQSYGRGAGTVPNSCGSGELRDGLCYSRCQAGFAGNGPVCWQICPAGYVDDGAFCRRPFPLHIFAKSSYGRGAGKTPVACPAGKENNGGLCYPVCQAGYQGVGPVCWKICPAGYTDDGAFCRKAGVITAKASYGRSAGNVPPCAALGRQTDHDHDHLLPEYLAPSKFTMIIASDPQMPWWRDGKDPNCNSKECVLAKAKSTNADQVAAMNRFLSAPPANPGPTDTARFWPTTTLLTRGAGSEISKPLGVIMNGDLTAFWHQSEVDLYREYFEPGFSDAPDHEVLQLPIFPGLGNHDYVNNFRDCFGPTADHNYCAKQAVNYMKDMVYCDKVSNFINPLVQRFDEKSLAYSFDIGNYHFVQMNFKPTYDQPEIGVQSALPWLKEDLAKAAADGRRVVLNFHEMGDGGDFGNPETMEQDPSQKAEYNAFLEVIKTANVVAVFSGHLHADRGYIGDLPGTKIPYFRSGASEYNSFLLVEFGEDYMNVGVMDSSGGEARFVNSGLRKDLATYVFPPAP